MSGIYWREMRLNLSKKNTFFYFLGTKFEGKKLYNILKYISLELVVLNMHDIPVAKFNVKEFLNIKIYY